ncbi:MAG: hypothetical protein ACUVQ0_01510 [Thermoproteota archaeon]
MSEFIREYEKKRGLSEKIASYIPGYRGYKQKEVRREADRLVRDFMVRRLESTRFYLKDVMGEVADADRADLFKTLNRVSAVLDRVLSKVKYADYGYSGFFDLVKISEEELDKLMDYDYRLLGACEEISGIAKETMESARAGSLDVLQNIFERLESKARDLETAYINREETIISLKGDA